MTRARHHSDRPPPAKCKTSSYPWRGLPSPFVTVLCPSPPATNHGVLKGKTRNVARSSRGWGTPYGDAILRVRRFIEMRRRKSNRFRKNFAKSYSPLFTLNSPFLHI